MSDNMRIGSGLNHIGYLQPGTELKLPSKPPEKTPEFVAPEDQVSFRTTVPFKPEKQIKEGLNLPEEKIILPAPKEIMELPEARFTESIGADRLTGSSAFTGKGSPTTLFIEDSHSFLADRTMVNPGMPFGRAIPENTLVNPGAYIGSSGLMAGPDTMFFKEGLNSIRSAGEGIYNFNGEKIG